MSPPRSGTSGCINLTGHVVRRSINLCDYLDIGDTAPLASLNWLEPILMEKADTKLLQDRVFIGHNIC